MTVYPLHPLCSLFPRMSGPDYDALVNDLRINGLREPITLHEGMVLDGGNRIRACYDAGIEPRFVQFAGGNLAAFVLSANLHRRHLSQGQQAAIVASAQDWSSAQVQGGNRGDGQKCKIALLPPLASSKDRAAQSGASVRTQKMADKVAKADPALATQVAHGDITLPAAMEKITGKRPGAKQKQAAKSDDTKPEYDPAEDALDSAHQTVRELAEENDALKDRLACEVMAGADDDKGAALATIQELRATIKTLAAELDAVKASRDQYMREAGAMKQQLKMQRNEIKKLKGQNNG